METVPLREDLKGVVEHFLIYLITYCIVFSSSELDVLSAHMFGFLYSQVIHCLAANVQNE